VQVNIKHLIDEVQCYQTVRELRWPDGVACPSCASQHVIKRGCDDTEPARQRYACHDCDQRSDDLTDTIVAGHHQLLKVWVLCLYFMGLNVSNEHIAYELGTRVYTDAYSMYTRLHDWGYDHKSVNHGRGEYARDDDGAGLCEVHVHTMEGFWSLLRSWLRPHRGISQEKLPVYLGFFEFVHNVRTRGKALLPALIESLVT